LSSYGRELDCVKGTGRKSYDTRKNDYKSIYYNKKVVIQY